MCEMNGRSTIGVWGGIEAVCEGKSKLIIHSLWIADISIILQLLMYCTPVKGKVSSAISNLVYQMQISATITYIHHFRDHCKMSRHPQP